MQESGVETVAGTDRVDRNDFLWWRGEALGAMLSQRSFGAEFYYDQRD